MQLTEIPITFLDVHPSNVRRAVGDVTELAASIAADGVLEPLLVVPVPDSTFGVCPACKDVVGVTAKGSVAAHTAGRGSRCPGSSRWPSNPMPRYVVIAGHRRLAAAKLAGVTSVPCVVRDDLTDGAAQVRTMLAENLHRDQLSAVEEAAGYQALLAFPDWTPQRIADELGRSAKTVKLRLGLTRLSPDVSDRLHAQQITLADAELLASFAKDPAATAELGQLIGTPNFRLRVQQFRDRADLAKKTAKHRDELLAAGVTVIPTPEGWPYRWDGERLDELDIEPSKHQSCPGHAAVVEANFSGVRTVWVCTQPDKHGHTEQPKPRRNLFIPPQRAIDPELVARDEALRAAVKVREQFVVDLMRQARYSDEQLLEILRGVTLALLGDLDYYGDESTAARMLGIPADTEDRAALIRKTADAARTVPLIVVVLLAAAHSLMAPGFAREWDLSQSLWVAALEKLGYQLSDVERAATVLHKPVEDVPVAGGVL